VIHARGQLGGPVAPDPSARDLNLTETGADPLLI
jgi:hypothetical protein